MGSIYPIRYDAAFEGGLSGKRDASDKMATDGDPLLARLARHLHVGAEVFFLSFEKFSRHPKVKASAKPVALAQAVDRICDEEVRDRMLQLLHRMQRAASETRPFPVIDHAIFVPVGALD